MATASRISAGKSQCGRTGELAAVVAELPGSILCIIIGIRPHDPKPFVVMQLETHSFGVEIECRYLLQVPEVVSPSTVVVIALHGYGSNPEDMLRLTTSAVGRDHILAAVQAPNQHYADRAPLSTHPAAAYNWGVRHHWEEAIRVHHAIVTAVLARLRKQFETPASRCVLLGFSQPVGLNYRFAGTHPDQVGGIIGICGGVPRDWDEEKYQTVAAPILHISREEDEFYPAAVASEFPLRLRRHASDVEFHMLPGGHRFPSQAGPLIREWMARVFAETPRSG